MASRRPSLIQPPVEFDEAHPFVQDGDYEVESITHKLGWEGETIYSNQTHDERSGDYQFPVYSFKVTFLKDGTLSFEGTEEISLTREEWSGNTDVVAQALEEAYHSPKIKIMKGHHFPPGKGSIDGPGL